MGEEGRELSFLEKAVRLIPGYKGYKRKEERRDNDQLLRTMLVQRLDKVRTGLLETLNSLQGPAALALAGDVDRLNKRLEKLSDEIRFADRGYRGWFDMHKVQEDELDRLYAFDAGLAEDIASIETALGALSEAARSGEATKAHTTGMLELIMRFSEKMASRNELMVDLENNRPID
jgi:hypothetical protein